MSAELERVTTALADHYDVERVLGVGGMATVFLARDCKHDRTVAVKVLHPDLAAAVGSERFLHEIKLTAQLNHPHVLSLIDSGEADGLLYYVMPYVDGESLRDRLDRERQLSIEESLKITNEVAGGLAHAHERGIVHRDIKPENILLSGEHAIIADFGIAHGVSEAGGERLTATGIAVGTPAYMSPEQSVGERDIDARSDVYSLGCVLYEMLVGEPPFTGPNTQAVIARKSLDSVPSIRTVRDTVTEGIDASVAKALARVPADRYKTTTEFVTALAEPYVSVAPVAVPHKRRASMALGLASIAVISGLALWRWIPVVDGLTILPAGSTIAVIPLAPSSPDAELERLGRDLVLTLSYNLSNQGDIRAVNPQSVLGLAGEPGKQFTLEESTELATQLGASSFLHGTVIRRGSDVQAIVALYDTRDTTELARTSVTAPLDDVVVFADSIALEILRQIWRRGEPLSPNLETTLTGSPEALRHFVDGEEAFAENRWEDAEEAYALAFHADTTFYLASVLYGYVTGYSRPAIKDSLVVRGLREHVDELAEPYRSWVHLDGTKFDLPTEWGDDTWTNWLRTYGRLAEKYPDHWHISQAYADQMSHWGPLFGYTADQALAAWIEVLDQNPQLTGKMRESWEHGLLLGLTRDPKFTDRALGALGPIHGWTGVPVRFRLLIAARRGQVDPLLVDSTVEELAGIAEERPHQRFLFYTAMAGLPQVSIEISTRLLDRDQLDLPGGTANDYRLGLALSWAARGAWDSALAAADRFADASTSAFREMERYSIAATGVILGGVDPNEAIARRPDTTSAAMSQWLSGVRWATGDDRRAELAWLDGMVAYAQADSAGVSLASETIARLRGPPEYPATSLQAFQWARQGDIGRAADTLVRIQINRRAGLREIPHGASILMDGISRLATAEWLLQSGDTALARKTLGFHEGEAPGWYGSAAMAPAASLALGRLAVIEEALGNDDLAIEYYQEFLRRYDMPPPEHQQWVDDAKEALARLIRTDPPRE